MDILMGILGSAVIIFVTLGVIYPAFRRSKWGTSDTDKKSKDISEPMFKILEAIDTDREGVTVHRMGMATLCFRDSKKGFMFHVQDISGRYSYDDDAEVYSSGKEWMTAKESKMAYIAMENKLEREKNKALQEQRNHALHLYEEKDDAE